MTSATITEADGSALDMTPEATDYASDYTLAKTLKIEYTQDRITESVDYPITIINNVEHILRGYENIIEKLTSVGAKISLIEK